MQISCYNHTMSKGKEQKGYITLFPPYTLHAFKTLESVYDDAYSRTPYKIIHFSKSISNFLSFGITSKLIFLHFDNFRLLRRDPMGALGYSSSKPSLAKIVEYADGRPHEMDIVAAKRNGEVLGRHTVLNSDHCPGCHNLHLPERVEGAPNFREIPEFPVYGVANPTVDGIRAVIQRISTSKGGRPILWHNMREEPVIYINGKPFVLREVERPYKNMLEYTVCIMSGCFDRFVT